MQQLTLPILPDGASEALVEHVYVATGDQVLRGQPLALVRTERFVYDIPASRSGTLLELNVVAGDRLSAGQLLAVLAEASALPDRPGAATAPANSPRGQHTPEPQAQAASASGSSASHTQTLRATPLARRVASVHALDLAQLASAAARLLRRDDVLRLLEATPPERAVLPAVAGQTGPASVLTAAPCAVTAMELDWSPVDQYLARRDRRSRRSGSRADRRACLVSAAAGALLRHSLLHAAWSERGILLRRGINISVGGRVVSGAADLSPGGVARALAEPSGAGDQHAFVIVEHATAMWSEAALPEAATAVLSVGQAETRLCVGAGDTITARPVSLLVLIYDARVLDQRSADAFLADVRARLERIGSLC